MFHKLFDAGRCMLGFHEGAWSYAAPDNCTQQQICSRCGAHNYRVEHTWGEWDYTADDNCEQQRHCQRCGESESQMEHVWSEPAYAQEGYCARVSVCQRCREEANVDTVHDWQQWTYVEDGRCQQGLYCARCGEASGEMRVQHRWQAPVASAFYGDDVHVCAKCGEMIVGNDGSGSLQQVAAATAALVEADSWEAVNGLLHQEQAILFSPAARHYWRFAAEQYPATEVRAAVQRTATVVERCRQRGIGPGVQSLANEGQLMPSGRKGPMRDPALVGHWRHTESMSSGGFSLVTDYHLILQPNGQFTHYSRSEGSMGSSSSGPETGAWSVAQNQLVLSQWHGLQQTHVYQVHGDQMLLDGRFWERIG